MCRTALALAAILASAWIPCGVAASPGDARLSGTSAARRAALPRDPFIERAGGWLGEHVPPRARPLFGPSDLGDGGAQGRAAIDLASLTLPELPVRFDPRVLALLMHYAEDPRARRTVQAWLNTAARWEAPLRRVLVAHGLPGDLVYVAMVESGLDPAARSSRGAAGIWQFVSVTAEQYGLERSRLVDERLDPERATVAAARHFADLHARFGSWELAFAAYNMGASGLLRSIRKYHSNDYWNLATLECGLPYETTIYVPKILAIALIAKNADRFGFERPGVVDGVSRVEVPGGTTLASIARASRVALEEVAALNPALTRRRVPPGTSRAVYLPSRVLPAFEARFRPRRDEGAPRRHVFRFGETLEDVARRYHTTADALRELNGMDDAVTFGFGAAIRVPDVDPEPPEPARDEALLVPVPSRAGDPAGRRRVFYVVRGPESIEDVAAFFGATLDQLASWNDIDVRARLQSGMVLQLFVPESFDLTRVVTAPRLEVVPAGSDAFFDQHEARRGRMRVRHRVAAGETTSSIGRRYGLESADVGRINGIPASGSPPVGSVVTVYTAAPPDRSARPASTDDGARSDGPREGASPERSAD